MQHFARRQIACLGLFGAAMATSFPGLAQSSVEMVGIKANQVFQRNGSAPTAPATVTLRPGQAIPARFTRYSISLLTPAGGSERQRATGERRAACRISSE